MIPFKHSLGSILLKLPAEASNDSNTFLNFVGNYFIPWPSIQRGPYEILFPEGNPRIYVEGNLGPHRPDLTIDEWSLVGFGWWSIICGESAIES